jgi:hypothetical protein
MNTIMSLALVAGLGTFAPAAAQYVTADQATPARAVEAAQPTPPVATTVPRSGTKPVTVEYAEPARPKGPAGPNVRVEVTLNEVGGAGAAVIKTVSVTTTNQNWGKLRSQVNSRAYGVTPLNVDVRPEVLADGKVELRVAIEYNQGRNPDSENNPDKIAGVMINQSATLLLDSGKPLTMSQSADPIGDRRVSVEVKATVIK